MDPLRCKAQIILAHSGPLTMGILMSTRTASIPGDDMVRSFQYCIVLAISKASCSLSAV
jgi:hypothetical protein